LSPFRRAVAIVAIVVIVVVVARRAVTNIFARSLIGEISSTPFQYLL
jgi:hypothetical protein